MTSFNIYSSVCLPPFRVFPFYSIVLAIVAAACQSGEITSRKPSPGASLSPFQLRAVVQPSDGTSPAILEALGLDLMQAQVVYPSNAQVTIAWRVYTNGDLDTKTSVKRVYASRQHAQNTNLVWLGQMGSKVFTIPHNPILIGLPSDEGGLGVARWFGDIFERGGVLESGSPVTLMEFQWVIGSGAGFMEIYTNSSGNISVQAEVAPLCEEVKYLLNEGGYYEMEYAIEK